MIAPSDRTDLIPGLMLAHQSGTFPTLAGILLTGGYEIPETITRLSAGVQQDLPIALTNAGTFATAERLMRVRGPLTKDSKIKIETARRLFAEGVDQEALLAAINVSASEVRTPLMFEYQLMERARADRQDDRAAGEHRRPDPRSRGDPAAPRRGRSDLARRGDQGPGPRIGAGSRSRRGQDHLVRPIPSMSNGSPPCTPRLERTRG